MSTSSFVVRRLADVRTAIFIASTLLFLAAVLTGCSSAPPTAKPTAGTAEIEPAKGTAPGSTGEKRTALLAINDIYRIQGLDDGATGGLARVRAAREALEATYPELLVLHAGDFLYPSFLSRSYYGAQMIDVLNHLDGDGEAFDERFLITFGNHEFERGGPNGAAQLDARVRESQFRWLGSNLNFPPGPDGRPGVAQPQMVDQVMLDSGGIRLGVFSLTIDTETPGYVEYLDPAETARRYTARLRDAGAEAVIALTHLDVEDDRQLLRQLGEDGPDLIIGGHEHSAQRHEIGGRWVLKADADARSAWVVEISRPADGPVRIAPKELLPLRDDSPVPDAEVEAVAAEWLERHDREYCGKIELPAGCLRWTVGHAATELVAEETEIRARETSLGNWLADLMLGAFADQGAQVAFVNSGSLRLNQDLPAGQPIQLGHVEELFQYPATVQLLSISGATLREIAEVAVSGWPGDGHWLQISGFAFRHDPESESVRDLTLLTPQGPRAVADDERILAVTSAYIAQGNDGFTMLNTDLVRESRGDLKHLAMAALRAAGAAGVAPTAEGRICNPPEALPCLAVQP